MAYSELPFMRVFLPLFLLLLFVLTPQAKSENLADGKISGRIIDSVSNQPIEYATIGLYLQGDNKVVNGTTSDGKGIFKLTHVPKGTYKLSINFMGYSSNEKFNIVIGKDNSTIVFGDIKLSSKQTMLKEVIITSERAIIENKIDMIVFTGRLPVLYNP